VPDAAVPPDNLTRFRSLMEQGWSAPVARLIGFRLVEIDRDRAVVELQAGPQHANPMGTLHGGILCDVADAAMGIAYASGIDPSESFTTIELKINFLRPVWTGPLRAEGTLLRRGRTVGLAQCRVLGEKGELVAYATSTCMTIPGGKGDGLERPRRPADAHGSPG
jgi:uncharacterized protein (TIGR00369 family)